MGGDDRRRWQSRNSEPLAQQSFWLLGAGEGWEEALDRNLIPRGLGPVPSHPPHLQACGRLGVELKSNPSEGGDEGMGHL